MKGSQERSASLGDLADHEDGNLWNRSQRVASETNLSLVVPFASLITISLGAVQQPIDIFILQMRAGVKELCALATGKPGCR